jgi:hypothetical protein
VGARYLGKDGVVPDGFHGGFQGAEELSSKARSLDNGLI